MAITEPIKVTLSTVIVVGVIAFATLASIRLSLANASSLPAVGEAPSQHPLAELQDLVRRRVPLVRLADGVVGIHRQFAVHAHDLDVRSHRGEAHVGYGSVKAGDDPLRQIVGVYRPWRA
jgi:hypothetical protein